MFSFSVYQKFIFCILSGFLTGLSHQPLSLGFLAWFSLVPFLYSVYSFTTKRRVVIAGFLFGFTYSLTQIFWLAFNIGTSPTVAKITAIAATLYLSIFYIIFALITYRIKIKSPWIGVWMMPVIWVAIEYVKSLGLLGFPWIVLGNSQVDYLYPIQIAEFTAVYGVSFWVMLINVGIIHWLEYRYKSTILILAVTISTPFFIGYNLLKNQNLESSKLNVTVIQPNIHLMDKHGRSPIDNLNLIIKTSNKFISDSTELLIWPETAVNTFVPVDSKTEKIIKNFLNNKSYDLLTGFPESEKSKSGTSYFNSIGQFTNDGLIKSYQKIHPVPMAEHIPLSSIFPSLKKLNLGQANWEIGNDFAIFETNEKKYSGVICYESTYPSLVRKFVNDGAEFIAVLVNDGWYETAPEPQQHASQSIFRAIENIRTIVRSANTGISLIVEPSGKIIKETVLNEKTGFNETINLHVENTFYTKYGDVFSWLMVIILFGILISGYKRE